MRTPAAGAVVGALALGLGLVVPPAAVIASCAGPQVSVGLAEFHPVPDGADPTTEPSYAVRPGQEVVLRGENLGPCVDTYVDGGCFAEPPPPPPDPEPGSRATFTLVQGGQRWPLGSAPLTARDVSLPAVLPVQLRPGPASLELLAPPAWPEGVAVRLDVRGGR